MTERDVVEAAEPVCSCKLGRNVRKYRLGDFDERLHRQRENGASLRDLEDVVNHAILRSAIEAADTEVIGDVETIYGKLVDDDVSTGERIEIREQLDRAGVDVEEIIDDFVSYQSVRTHLRECLDIDTDRRESLSVDDARGTIEWARSKSEGIVRRTIERLGRNDSFQMGDVEVSHDVRVSCPECNRSFSIDEFLDRGGCDCRTE